MNTFFGKYKKASSYLTNSSSLMYTLKELKHALTNAEGKKYWQATVL